MWKAREAFLGVQSFGGPDGEAAGACIWPGFSKYCYWKLDSTSVGDALSSALSSLDQRLVRTYHGMNLCLISDPGTLLQILYLPSVELYISHKVLHKKVKHNGTTMTPNKEFEV